MFSERRSNSPLNSEKGSALLFVVMITALLFPLLFSGVRFSSLNLRVSSNLKLGGTALQVADTAIQHALAVIPSGYSFSYSTDPYNPSCIIPSTNCGTDWFDFGGGYRYKVTAINTAGGLKAILTSTAEGPNSVQKTITAYVSRGNYGFGATSLNGSTAAATETSFSGTSFHINGTDGCGQAPAVPGISVTDSGLQTEITNNTTSDGGLASNQMSLVTGAASSPSVMVVPPTSQTVSQLADQFLALNPPGHTELNGQNFSGNDTWGTAATPQITRIIGTTTISGTITGYGVLIVDGPLTIQGNFTFNGLVIARGDVRVQDDLQVEIQGNATINGALMLGESINYDPQVELDVRGNGSVRFNSCNLAAANGWVNLPKQAKLVAWHEKLS